MRRRPRTGIDWSHLWRLFLIQVLGFTIERLTLLATVLSIGVVVDDALVVVENGASARSSSGIVRRRHDDRTAVHALRGASDLRADRAEHTESRREEALVHDGVAPSPAE